MRKPWGEGGYKNRKGLEKKAGFDAEVGESDGVVEIFRKFISGVMRDAHIFMNKKGRKQKKYGEHFKNTNDFIQKLNDYIYYYNNDRISLKLKGMSPVQFRTHSFTS